MVTELIEHDNDNEIPFSSEAFRIWSLKGLGRKGTLVFAGMYHKTPVSFAICFGPWELCKDVWVFYGYIRPRFRGTGVLEKGIGVIRAWAKKMGAQGIDFETDRPKAWNKIINFGSFHKFKFNEEIT